MNTFDPEAENVVSVSHAVAEILTNVQLGGVATSSGEVVQRLQDTVTPGQTDALVVEMLDVLTEVAALGEREGVTYLDALEQVLLSGMHPLKKRIVVSLREQPELFAWIQLGGPVG